MWRLRGLVALVAMCATPASSLSAAPRCPEGCFPRPAPARFLASATGGAGIGTYAPYGTTRVALGLELWERLDLTLALHNGFSDQLLLINPALRVGMVLHLSDSADLVLAGEAGYGAMRFTLPLGSPWVHQAVFRMEAELRFALPFHRDLQLLGTPLAAVAFWSRLWAMVFQPSVGLAYRF